MMTTEEWNDKPRGEPADKDGTIRHLRAQLAALKEAGDDVIRSSNTMMLMLVGDHPMTKLSVESAIRRNLDARNEWDNVTKGGKP